MDCQLELNLSLNTGTWSEPTYWHRGIERKRSGFSHVATLSGLIQHNPLRITILKIFFYVRMKWWTVDKIWMSLYFVQSGSFVVGSSATVTPEQGLSSTQGGPKLPGSDGRSRSTGWKVNNTAACAVSGGKTKKSAHSGEPAALQSQHKPSMPQSNFKLYPQIYMSISKHNIQLHNKSHTESSHSCKQGTMWFRQTSYCLHNTSLVQIGINTDREGGFGTHIRWRCSGKWIVNCCFHPMILGSQYMNQGTREANKSWSSTPSCSHSAGPGTGWKAG